MQLSIIIVNYNVKYFLEQCLCTVKNAIKNIDAEVFIIDNNSTDGSKEYLENKFSFAKFIWNSNNVGFAKANNQVLYNCKGKYILYLNPDTLVPENTFETCIQFFKKNNNAGALGVRMIDGKGNFLPESKRAYPDLKTSFFKLSGLAKIFPKHLLFSKYHLGYLNEHQIHEVDVLAGAFMMVRKDILLQLGGFDENYFMYGEDVDLSYAIQKLGYKNYYLPTPSIIHFKGESTKKGSMNYVKLFYKAMVLFVEKNNTSNSIFGYKGFIKTAIFFRGLLTALGKIILKIGIPFLDILIIFSSFWITKFVWQKYIKQGVIYDIKNLWIVFSIYTFVFLITSFYSGLYENKYRQKQLSKSWFWACIILFIIYSFLNTDYRFSRGILFFGVLLVFMAMFATRYLFLSLNIIKKEETETNFKQVLIVGSADTYKKIEKIIHEAGYEHFLLGRVATYIENENTSLGNIDEIPNMTKYYPIKEIIYSDDKIGYQKIIEIIEKNPKHINNKFFSIGSNSIIGSNNKNESGELITFQKKYKLSNEFIKRQKRFFDFILALLFLLLFPIIFLYKKPIVFFKNIFAVLLNKKTWVSYTSNNNLLPQIKNGILKTVNVYNSSIKVDLFLIDSLYAQNYSVLNDFKIIIRNYKILDT